MSSSSLNNVSLNYRDNDVVRATMSMDEACLYLGISRPLLTKMVTSGNVKCKRCGNRYLFTKKMLDEWLTEDN